MNYHFSGGFYLESQIGRSVICLKLFLTKIEKNMTNLFYMGGTLFMSILTLEFLIALVIAVIFGKLVFKENKESAGIIRHKLTYIKSMGLLALVTGILGQIIGLFSAFGHIEKVGSVSPGVLMAGLKVSMVTTLYGLVIWIITFLIWFVLDARLDK